MSIKHFLRVICPINLSLSFILLLIRTMYKVMIRKLCIPQDSSSKMTRVNLKIPPSNHRYLRERKKKKNSSYHLNNQD